MRLTRLEIHGFKSFADRTSLELPAGLTAIVGPNGCGKSNVIDAVKWALGEQKASALRGAEMLDVVFKGNGARGARNFAEVSLVFDNEDGVLPTEYAEVVITRRLFRSGESEYLINKKSCRLKDVRNLLMDTGLGFGAYSVMEQGRIDAILSANPTERRRIFEEAAGISRYRARCREAESKLTRTEQNLLRLGDVVDELERRERSLKQQAGRARSYIAARDRIQLLKSRFYVHQYVSFGKQLETQEQAVTAAELVESEARQIVEQARAEVALVQERLTATRHQVDEAAEAFRKASGEVEGVAERESALHERLGESQERHELLQSRLAGLEQALAEREREAAGIQTRFEAADKEVAACESQLSGKREACQVAETALADGRTLVEERRKAALTRVEQLTTTRNERAECGSRRAALVASRDRLDTHLRELSVQKHELAAVQGELFSGARDLEATAIAGRERVEQATRRRDSLKETLSEADARLAQRREDLAGNESHRKALEELVAQRDGVAPGAISLLDADLPGVNGLLVDHLRAPAHLAEAVEAALGATTQAVLVDSREGGLAALAHLRRAQAGRVLVVPRDSVRARQGAAEGPRLLDSIQVLEHQAVFEALLGHVRLLSDRDDLLRCQPDGTTVWVTPEGDLLDERGVLRGGAAGEEGGLVSRRAERDALAAKCDRIRGEIEHLTTQRTQVAHELARIEEHLGAAQEHARKVEGDRERAQERERQSAARQHAVHKELAVRTGDRRELQVEVGEVDASLQALKASERELTVQVDVDREALVSIENQLHTLQAELTERQEHLASARLELSTQQERREALAGEKRHVERGVEERRQEMTHHRDESQQLVERRERLQKELGEIKERGVALAEVRDERAGELGEAREAAQTLVQEQTQVQERVQTVESELESASGLLSTRRLESQETRIRRDELRRQVMEELEVDLEEELQRPVVPIEVPVVELAENAQSLDGVVVATCALPPHMAAEAAAEAGEGAEDGIGSEAAEPTLDVAQLAAEAQSDDTDWAAVEAEIEELRGRLARMGNVNLEAVDELNQVEERLTFLVGQRDDLLQARVTLNETITRVNKESRERFQVTFDEVREHFRVIFRKLFRGGRADITLGEGEDILEAGIEITAAPPGKDSRTITLLSGGERTLTAVGMLFALFRARPSPVCLLDEVDAALDETNIDRFCSVLEDFLGQSQFIVVTHARRTMSYSDTVFGVTMQEHGVSKVLSLTLEEYDAQHQGARKARLEREANGTSKTAAEAATRLPPPLEAPMLPAAESDPPLPGSQAEDQAQEGETGEFASDRLSEVTAGPAADRLGIAPGANQPMLEQEGEAGAS